ncbi:hypothetical protein ABH924_004456 [Arthrobacter sp. GAS37]
MAGAKYLGRTPGCDLQTPPSRKSPLLRSELSKIRRRSSRAALTISALLLGQFVTSCGDAPGDKIPTQQEPAIAVVPNPASGDAVSRPIDHFLPSSMQILALAKAQQRDVNECLQAHGSKGHFQWSSSDAELTHFIDGLVRDRTIRSDLWGYFDVANATIHGYKRGDGSGAIESSGEGAPNDLADRCLDEAVKSHLGMVAFTFAEDKALIRGGPVIALADSRYVRVSNQWSACMKAEGFEYRDPIAAIDDVKWRGTEKATALEVAVATADVRCKVETNLVGLGAAVRSAYDNRYLTENAQELNDFKDRLRQYSD